jgi:hypothetical protein
VARRRTATIISQKRKQHLSNALDDRCSTPKRVSEADLMIPGYPFHRRIESKWTERLKSLGERIAVAIERSLQGAFNQEGSLIPVKISVDRRRRDRSQSR